MPARGIRPQPTPAYRRTPSRDAAAAPLSEQDGLRYACYAFHQRPRGQCLGRSARANPRERDTWPSSARPHQKRTRNRSKRSERFAGPREGRVPRMGGGWLCACVVLPPPSLEADRAPPRRRLALGLGGAPRRSPPRWDPHLRPHSQQHGFGMGSGYTQAVDLPPADRPGVSSKAVRRGWHAARGSGPAVVQAAGARRVGAGGAAAPRGRSGCGGGGWGTGPSSVLAAGGTGPPRAEPAHEKPARGLGGRIASDA
jgi:hypothetical protein